MAPSAFLPALDPADEAAENHASGYPSGHHVTVDEHDDFRNPVDDALEEPDFGWAARDCPLDFPGEPDEARSKDLPIDLPQKGTINLDAVCATLIGAPAEEAEKHLREVLSEAHEGGRASEADVLAGLLNVFKSSRDFELEEVENPEDAEWSIVLPYCRRLTDICDAHFLLHEGADKSKNLPPSVVAGVYAECGRTFALAGKLGLARDRLEKSMNVFQLVRKGDDSTIDGRAAATCASLARVLQRMDARSHARARFLEAAGRFSELPDASDAEGLASEIADFIISSKSDPSEVLADADILVSAADLVEAQFGSGSEEHLEALKRASDFCMDNERLDLACPLLAIRADVLKSWGLEDYAIDIASTCEALAAAHLSGGNLEEGVEAWEGALAAREHLEGPDSTLCMDMRSSLLSLKAAAAAQQRSTAEQGAETASTKSGDKEDGWGSAEDAPDSWEDHEV